MTTTWTMKRKANGTFRARINARGYEQIDGIHFDGSSIAVPVTNEITVRVVFVIGLMADWIFELLDVHGAFLLGLFGDEEEMFIEVPRDFEKRYEWYGDVVLKLMHTIYGTKQAAMAYWREQTRAMKDMKYKRNDIDPCLNFKWTDNGLTVWLSWVDDNIAGGKSIDVKKAVKDMEDRFDCEHLGEMNEYLGCKIEHNKEKREIKFTQPVTIQSFTDEFKFVNKKRITPAELGSILTPAEERNYVKSKTQKYYRSGVGKLNHMGRWSRPEIQNAVRELSRSMKGASEAHITAMHRVMEYYTSTESRGWTLKPKRKWDGKSKDFEFEISGKADSDYAKCPVTSKSVSGYTAFLEKVPITAKSGMQKSVALSVTEAEASAGIACAQDMLFIMKLLESMGLKVKKPMILEIDNKGTVDLANNWCSSGKTRHVNELNFLTYLKEEGLIKVIWIAGTDNDANLFTKNLAGPAFNKHGSAYYGKDEYYTWE